MITLYKEIGMTTEIERADIFTGTGSKNSFLLTNTDIWKVCVNEMKELNYSVELNRIEFLNTPKATEKVISLPSTALEVTRLNTETTKTYADVVYVYTPTPIAAGVYFKLEHDYTEITEATLSMFGGSYTRCVACSPASAGPWPLSIQITIPASTDIRLFSDLQLCAISLDNTANTTYLDINTDGEVDLCKFASTATQTRRVRIYEL